MTFRVTPHDRDLMQEVMQDRRAMLMLLREAENYNIYQILQERGDPRFWPEYLTEVHPPADAD